MQFIMLYKAVWQYLRIGILGFHKNYKKIFLKLNIKERNLLKMLNFK